MVLGCSIPMHIKPFHSRFLKTLLNCLFCHYHLPVLLNGMSLHDLSHHNAYIWINVISFAKCFLGDIGTAFFYLLLTSLFTLSITWQRKVPKQINRAASTSLLCRRWVHEFHELLLTCRKIILFSFNEWGELSFWTSLCFSMFFNLYWATNCWAILFRSYHLNFSKMQKIVLSRDSFHWSTLKRFFTFNLKPFIWFLNKNRCHSTVLLIDEYL